jgi:polyisoprenoid-binding protein YceI
MNNFKFKNPIITMKNTIFYSAIAATFLFASCSGGGESKVEEGAEAATATAEAKNYTIDPQSSSVEWFAEKVTGKHNGTVAIKSGELKVENEAISAGNFVMDMNTITVLDMPADDEYNVKLTGHLKSEDFFNVESAPESSFEVVSVEKIEGAAEGASNYNVKGNLTIKGITKAITFPASVSISGDAVNANAEFEIDRTEWDIKYGSGKFFQDIGDKAIYDNFKIKFNITAKA